MPEIRWESCGITLPLVLLIIVASFTGPWLFDATMQRWYRSALAADVVAFYAAVQAAQQTAQQQRQRIGVEFTPVGWTLFRDQGAGWQHDAADPTLHAGRWNPDTRYGSPIAEHRFYFDEHGGCRVAQAVACVEEGTADNAPLDIISLTSHARRIYTVLFKAGVPRLEYDDF